MIPLYLGADLLSNTDIRIENHPRYHAKFAKKGLATKVKFSSGKLKKEHNALPSRNKIYKHDKAVVFFGLLQLSGSRG